MKKYSRFFINLSIILLGSALIVSGCKNDLITTIEEEVEVAITPPSISNIYPQSGATDIAVNTNAITVDFTKPIDASSVTSSTVTIRNESGAAVSGTFSVSGQTISFTPSGNLSYSHTYTITITSGVKDLDGNSITEDFSWTFTTTFDPDSDRTPPVITEFLVNGGANGTNQTEVSLFLVAEDSGGSGISEYKVRASSEEWPADWSALTEGTVFISGMAMSGTPQSGDEVSFEAVVRDVEGNISSVSSDFIIYDLTPPSIVSRSPAENQTNIPYNASVVEVIFTDEMDPVSFTDDNMYVEKDGIPQSGQFEFSSHEGLPLSRVEITGLVLDPNSDYVVKLKSTIRDLAGNEFGYDENWFFRTGSAIDSTPLKVLSP